MSIAKICGWCVVGLVALLLQGLLVFALYGSAATFMSASGLKCLLFPLPVDLIAAILALKAYDDLHAGAVSNRHSLIGAALRNEGHRPPLPPPTSEAWNGSFADMNEASKSMRKER